MIEKKFLVFHHPLSAYLFLICLIVLSFSFPEFPKGSKKSDGTCFLNHIHNEHMNWIWDKPRENNSFYELYPLNESNYRSFETEATTEDIFFDYYLPQEYLNTRFTPKDFQTRQIYNNFSELESAENYTHYLDPRYNTKELTRRKYQQRFWRNLLLMRFNDHHRQLAIFHNVLTTNRGLIIDQNNCQFVYTGGCAYMFDDTFYYDDHLHVIQSYYEVITLTGGASGTWHFPMELLVSLTGLSNNITENDKVYFHLPRSNDFTMAWMNLLKIPRHRLITEPIIKAKQLYAPEPARCGETYATQLEWINKHFNPLPKEEQEVSRYREIVHIIRTKSRSIQNEYEVHLKFKEFAKRHRYNYIVHYEENLPSLHDQILRFARAPIVIAPHGAGLLFTAFSPSNACIREFMPPNNPECYARIAFIKKLNYRMYMVQNSQWNMTHVEESLVDCHRHFEVTLKAHNANAIEFSSPSQVEHSRFGEEKRIIVPTKKPTPRSPSTVGAVNAHRGKHPY